MKNFDVLCFGDSDWWYHNRGHMDIQLMKRYARTARVLYVNSVVVRKFNVTEGKMFIRRLSRKVLSIMRGASPSGIENMTVYSPFTLPVHHVPGARELNAISLRIQVESCMRSINIRNPVVWVVCPGAAEAAIKLRCTGLVYQRSDRYEDLPGIDGKQVERYDRLLKKNADLVVYVNRQLFEAEGHQCRKAIYLDHGVDYDAFAGAELDNFIPVEMAEIPHPILGFYGGIDAYTSDVSLIEGIADALADFSVVLIGSASVDLSNLASRKNVYIIGQRPYEQIPDYAKCFDVCFMAWQQNEWIKSCNPIKLKEYLALGKPVVSTWFDELKQYDGLVKIADNAESFAGCVKKALQENSPCLIDRRRRAVRGQSWESKANAAMATLVNVVSGNVNEAD